MGWFLNTSDLQAQEKVYFYIDDATAVGKNFKYLGIVEHSIAQALLEMQR